ncbi:MAG: BatA domain-containing protein [Elusimicrobia bacterium]|nr:BatA domain-containing protein [Elusimicrobiota bacterium]
MLKFLNASALWLLPLAGVPLIVHLLTRKKSVVFYFPSVRFLKKAARRKTFNFNILNLILLILRTFAVLCLVLFLARPSVVFFAPPSGETAIFVDYSYSMNQRIKDSTAWRDAVDIARSIVESRGGKDCFLFLFNRKIELAGGGFPGLDKLQSLPAPVEISSACGNMIADAVRKAQDFKKVFIVSDFCWEPSGKKDAVKWPEVETVCFSLGRRAGNYMSGM